MSLRLATPSIAFALLAWSVTNDAFRVRVADTTANAEAKAADDADGEVEGGKVCCCKDGPCRPGSKDTIYYPDEHMCCKKRDSCGGSMTSYKDAPDASYCEDRSPPPELPLWMDPAEEVEEVDPAGLKGHAATLHKHCATAAEDEDEDAARDRAKLINMFAKQLQTNSVLSSTRELFTMYACVRWAPDLSYWALAKDELDNGQLPQGASSAEGDYLMLTARAAERGHFVPLRCSENIGVYDREDKDGGHYKVFEERLGSMAKMFLREVNGFFDARVRVVEQTKPFQMFASAESKRERWNKLLKETLLFNKDAVKKQLKACQAKMGEKKLGTNVRKEDGETLMEDCDFLQWWKPKLGMYLSRFPYQAFLSGQQGASISPGNHVILCFGKRVAGELHRRTEGTHILTDMNGVGCHGFWDFEKAAGMLQNIIALWAPPTCQLTHLELKMRSRMLSMFAEMNKKLFEALPSIVASEQFSNAQPSAKEAAGLSKILAGGKWVYNQMSALFDTYKSFGELMSTSTMKWSVCPIGETEGIEKVLGSDDMVVQKATQDAYKQWTGKSSALPGEVCTASTGDLEVCTIGTVRQNYPEVYHDAEYACPALPLLPALQQFKILSDTHDTKCFVMASYDQLGGMNWFYKGLRPLEVQFPPRDHLVTNQMEMVKILSQRSVVDDHGISRGFVTLGRVCTLEVRTKYPDWCRKPELLNEGTLGGAVQEGVDGMIDGVTGMVVWGGASSSNDKAAWKSWANRQALGVGSAASNAFSHLSPTAIGNWASSIGGSTKTRLDRIRRNRMYESEEAGEALWGMTFQKQEAGGGERNQFNRYVVSVPCDGIDVKEEIKSEFAWGQAALETLEKATKHKKALLEETNLKLGVRTEVELLEGGHMKQGNHIAYRAGSSGSWSMTEDSMPHVEQLFSLGSRTSVSVSMPEVYGAEFSFICGRREDVYHGTATQKLKKCVADGVKQVAKRDAAQGKTEAQLEALNREIAALEEKVRQAQLAADRADEGKADKANMELAKQVGLLQAKEQSVATFLQDKPLTLKEYDDEIVVRVDVTSLPACQKFPGRLEEVSTNGRRQEASFEEKKNYEAAEAMKRRSRNCQSVPGPTGHKGAGRTGIVGAYMGNSAPKNTRKQIILSPADVQPWM